MKKVTVNIPEWLNTKLVGNVNFSKVLSDVLEQEVKLHKDNMSNGKLRKKTLVIDEDLLNEAKDYNINLSQVLQKALVDILEAKELINKYKK